MLMLHLIGFLVIHDSMVCNNLKDANHMLSTFRSFDFVIKHAEEIQWSIWRSLPNNPQLKLTNKD
jgi:hypothetical protein